MSHSTLKIWPLQMLICSLTARPLAAASPVRPRVADIHPTALGQNFSKFLSSAMLDDFLAGEMMFRRPNKRHLASNSRCLFFFQRVPCAARARGLFLHHHQLNAFLSFRQPLRSATLLSLLQANHIDQSALHALYADCDGHCRIMSLTSLLIFCSMPDADIQPYTANRTLRLIVR